MSWPRPHVTARRALPAAIVLAAGGLAVLLLVRPTAVGVVPAARRDLAPAIQGVGTVEARVIVQVAAKITGRIAAITADQGDPVEAGQVVEKTRDIATL